MLDADEPDIGEYEELDQDYGLVVEAFPSDDEDGPEW